MASICGVISFIFSSSTFVVMQPLPPLAPIMTRCSRMALSILLVPGLLRRIFRAWRKLALALKRWFLRRLSSYRTINSEEDNTSSRKQVSKHAKSSPESTPKYNGRSETTIGKTGKEFSDKKTDEEFQYSSIDNGERISLHDVLPSSLYPLSGGGIHNASKSTQSLASSISAHSRSIAGGTGKTPAQSIVGTSLHTGPSSVISINVISPPNSPNHQTLHPSVRSELSSRQSRPPSPNEEQERSSVSDADSAHTSSRSLSPIEERAPSPLADSGIGILPDIGNGADERMQQGPVGYVDVEPWPLGFPNPATTYISPLFPIHRPIIPLGDINIVPIMPESMLRYHGRPQIANVTVQSPIPPLTTKFGELSHDEWEICLHPEGARYFYSRKKRIYIEGDVDLFGGQVKEIVNRIEQRFVIRDGNTDLVVWLRTPTRSNPGAEVSACYYFVHHPTKTIFFLDNYDPKNLPAYKELRNGPTSLWHLGLEIETQYWFHCQLFPHSLRLTQGVVDELRSDVLHFIGDTTTSPKCSTAPFSLEDLYRIMSLIGEMEKYVVDDFGPSGHRDPPGLSRLSDPSHRVVSPRSVGASSCFARHMFIFSRARFLHYHGEPHARLDRTASVYGEDPHQRTFLIRSLSWVLFFAPDFHLRDLQSIWVDGITHKSVFQAAVSRMNEEWAQTSLLATVFLAVDVGFWSIQSNVMSTGPNRSIAQIFSYLSASACLCSIVLGLLLLLQNQTKMRETAEDFEKYMIRWNHRYLGLENLAILRSLPFATLLWGIVFFSLAILSLCFMDSDKPTIITMALAAAISLFLVFWCVWAHWDKEEQEQSPEAEELEQTDSSEQTGDETNNVYLALHPGNGLGPSYEMGYLPNSSIDPAVHALHFQPNSGPRVGYLPNSPMVPDPDVRSPNSQQNSGPRNGFIPKMLSFLANRSREQSSLTSQA